MQQSSQAHTYEPLVRLSRVAALWAFGYGLYRAYYAAGGTFGTFGTPVSMDVWYRINAIAAGLLFITALVPLAVLNKWRHHCARPLLLAICWIIAVGCISHALIGMVQRGASLTGHLIIDYPFWQTIDRREADLQALFFNEPWFLGQGLLWIGLAWFGALRTAPRRAWWFGSVIVATAIFLTIGLLSAFGRIDKFIFM